MIDIETREYFSRRLADSVEERRAALVRPSIEYSKRGDDFQREGVWSSFLSAPKVIGQTDLESKISQIDVIAFKIHGILLGQLNGEQNRAWLVNVNPTPIRHTQAVVVDFLRLDQDHSRITCTCYKGKSDLQSQALKQLASSGIIVSPNNQRELFIGVPSSAKFHLYSTIINHCEIEISQSGIKYTGLIEIDGKSLHVSVIHDLSKMRYCMNESPKSEEHEPKVRYGRINGKFTEDAFFVLEETLHQLLAFGPMMNQLSLR